MKKYFLFLLLTLSTLHLVAQIEGVNDTVAIPNNGSPMIFSVLDNDIFTPPVTLGVPTFPGILLLGQVEVSTDMELIYTPQPGATGLDSLLYQFTDATGENSWAWLFIWVASQELDFFTDLPNEYCTSDLPIVFPPSQADFMESMDLDWSIADNDYLVLTNEEQIGTFELGYNDGTTNLTANITLLESPSFDLGPDLEIPVGGSVMLPDLSGFLSYNWSPSVGLSDPTVSNPIASPDVTTTYTLTTTNAAGCVGSDEVIVVVDDPCAEGPPFLFNTQYCADETIIFFGSPEMPWPGFEFEIYLDGVLLPNNTISGLPSGEYLLAYIMTNLTTGCVYEEEFTLEIVGGAALDLEEEILVDETTESVLLDLTILDPVSFALYNWSTGETTEDITVYNEGTYTVSVFGGVACQSVASVTVECAPDLDFNVSDDLFLETTDAPLTFNIPAPWNPTLSTWASGGIGNIVMSTIEYDTYIVNGMTNFGCEGIDTFHIFPAVGVYPGDANNDGVANNEDLLAIGLAYGTIGEGRPQPYNNLDWVNQGSFPWATEFTDTSLLGLNHRFADCNGDAIINDEDTLAISLNYGLTHGKNSLVSDNGIPLSWEVMDTIVEGAEHIFAIHLGNDDVAAEEVYGISFSIHFSVGADSLVLNEPQFSIGNSWLGTKNVDLLTIDTCLENTLQWDVALTRIDQTNRTGVGEICRIACIMEVGSLKNEDFDMPITLNFDNITLIGVDGKPLEVNPEEQEVTIVLGAEEMLLPPYFESVALFPNPATNQLQLQHEQLPLDQTFALQVFDVRGKRVHQQAIEPQ
ncbi:MAG: Ig-like domain-containing protein, partial [Chitinophagales bacterium]